MDNPQIDFVGRANKEQGVTAKVNIIENIPPYKAGNLTLALGGAYLGSCFIQRNDFYTSQNVIVLKPKTNMSFKVKQFLSTTIFVESQLHYKAFIDELNPHIKTDFEFKLPVDTGGNPDWKYMEDYISIIETKVTLNNAKQIKMMFRFNFLCGKTLVNHKNIQTTSIYYNENENMLKNVVNQLHI